jgi:hypothetical protein
LFQNLFLKSLPLTRHHPLVQTVYLCLPCLYCSSLLLHYCGYVPLIPLFWLRLPLLFFVFSTSVLVFVFFMWWTWTYIWAVTQSAAPHNSMLRNTVPYKPYSAQKMFCLYTSCSNRSGIALQARWTFATTIRTYEQDINFSTYRRQFSHGLYLLLATDMKWICLKRVLLWNILSVYSQKAAMEVIIFKIITYIHIWIWVSKTSTKKVYDEDPDEKVMRNWQHSHIACKLLQQQVKCIWHYCQWNGDGKHFAIFKWMSIPYIQTLMNEDDVFLSDIRQFC